MLMSHPARDWPSQPMSSGCLWVIILAFGSHFHFSFCLDFHFLPFAQIFTFLFSHFACRHWKASSTPVLLRSRKPTLTLSSKGDETHLHSLQGSPCLLPASLISQVSCDVHPNIVLFEIMQCHVWIFWKYFARGNHKCIEFKALCNKKETSAHATSTREEEKITKTRWI